MPFRHVHILQGLPQGKNGEQGGHHAAEKENAGQDKFLMECREVEIKGLFPVLRQDSRVEKEVVSGKQEVGGAHAEQGAGPFPPRGGRIGKQDDEKAGQAEEEFRAEDRERAPEKTGIENGRVGFFLPVNRHAVVDAQDEKRITPENCTVCHTRMDDVQAEENECNQSWITGKPVSGCHEADSQGP